MTAISSKTGLSERQLYEAVHARMRSLAGPGARDLDDLIQTAATQAFKAIERFDGTCSLSTWLYAVCYRVLLTERRWYRRWLLRFSYADGEDPPDELPTPPELLEARARTRELRRALAQLSDKYRTVVTLHDLQELEVREIAIILQANERTVRSRLRDGRKQLAKVLQATAAPPPLGASHEPHHQ